MTIAQKLQDFYTKNNLSTNGGEDDDWFYLHFKLFSLKLPNPTFRKKIIHIHDVQHVLYDCDVTWKGEAFIAGWEIATGMWKQFPIGFMSLWAMGFSLWVHPKEVFKGYLEGTKVNGLVDLNISKEVLLQLTLPELTKKLIKTTPQRFIYFTYSFWVLVSSLILLSTVLLLVIGVLTV